MTAAWVGYFLIGGAGRELAGGASAQGARTAEPSRLGASAMSAVVRNTRAITAAARRASPAPLKPGEHCGTRRGRPPRRHVNPYRAQRVQSEVIRSYSRCGTFLRPQEGHGGDDVNCGHDPHEA